ncbi:MAG: serine/threonine-protein kinase, partial [Opitutaceae bacterium]
VALAEKRGGDDNISLQLIEIRDWESQLEPAMRSATLGGRTDRARRPGQPQADSGTLAAATGTELAPGVVLDNRFEITDLVARSNMASIFRAMDRKTSRPVAIKVPLSSWEGDTQAGERFRREEEIGAKLDHPGILKVVPVDEKSRPYLVMEFLEGKTLADLLARRKRVSEGEAIAFAIKICDALEYLHERHIVHRDLKPQNIMLCGDGSLRLFDFGIARTGATRRLTFVGLTPAMGTPDYISPEQVKGKRGDPQSDLYSLGAVLYEMVTGATPFEGESPYVVMNARVTGDPPAPRRLKPEIHPALEEIILHALERDPRQRYRSAAEMRRDLSNLDGVLVTGRCDRLRSPQPWHSVPSAVRVGIVIAAGLGLAFWLLFLALGRLR